VADGWRFADLTREALRNALGRGARLLPAVALAGLLGAGSVAILALEQRALDAEISSLTAQGRGVIGIVEVSPERPATISRSSCEDLTEMPGVQNAGIVVEAGRADAEPFTIDAPARRASTTLFPALGSVDVLLGGTLAAQEHTFHTFIYGQPFLAAVAEPSREGTGSTFSLTFPLLPTDTTASRCVVLLDPLTSADEVSTDLIARLDIQGNPVNAQEVLTTPIDPIDDYLTRPGRHAPLALGVVGGLLTALITRSRTSELAVYRLSGTSRTSLLTLLSLENAVIAGLAASVSAISALLLAAHLLDPATAVTAGIALAGAWALVATIGTIDIAFRRPTDLAKDR